MKDTEELSEEELRETLRSWQKWWQRVGSNIFKDFGFSSRLKPPVLKEDSEFYSNWIQDG